MTQNEIREKLIAAERHLTEHPDEARYTDSIATAKVTNPNGLRAEVTSADGARLVTDMPESVGGTNSAPSPGWLLRAAEASCVATLIAMRAAHERVPFESLEVAVDSESDDYGILGLDESVPAGPLRTRVRVTIREQRVDDDDDNVWQAMVAWAVDHCPVTDAVRRAVPLTFELVNDEDTSSTD